MAAYNTGLKPVLVDIDTSCKDVKAWCGNKFGFDPPIQFKSTSRATNKPDECCWAENYGVSGTGPDFVAIQRATRNIHALLSKNLHKPKEHLPLLARLGLSEIDDAPTKLVLITDMYGIGFTQVFREVSLDSPEQGHCSLTTLGPKSTQQSLRLYFHELRRQYGDDLFAECNAMIAASSVSPVASAIRPRAFVGGLGNARATYAPERRPDLI